MWVPALWTRNRGGYGELIGCQPPQSSIMLRTFRSFTALSTYVPQAYLSFSLDHGDINIGTKENGTIHRGSAVILTYQLNIVIDKDVSPLEIIKEIYG